VEAAAGEAIFFISRRRRLVGSVAHKSTAGERAEAGEAVIQLFAASFLPKSAISWCEVAIWRLGKESAGTELERPGLVRLPTIAAIHRAQRTQTPCADPLPERIDDLLNEILSRVARTIDGSS